MQDSTGGVQASLSLLWPQRVYTETTVQQQQQRFRTMTLVWVFAVIHVTLTDAIPEPKTKY